VVKVVLAKIAVDDRARQMFLREIRGKVVTLTGRPTVY
jgi:hypothetical protein